jgi:dephospho-CoA kinase
MIKIGILGNIGSGKSYIAQNFGYPVFDADHEVARLYKKNKKIFNKLKAKLPKFIHSFPIEKEEITNAILANKNNLNKLTKIVHAEIRRKLNDFLKKK